MANPIGTIGEGADRRIKRAIASMPFGAAIDAHVPEVLSGDFIADYLEALSSEISGYAEMAKAWQEENRIYRRDIEGLRRVLGIPQGAIR